MPRTLAAIALAMSLLASGTGSSLAHAMLMPETAAPGELIDASFTIGHCDGSPTVEVRVRLPEGFMLAGVPGIDGWAAETTGSATQIVWRGGSVPDDGFAEFAITGSAHRTGRLQFPLTQVCAAGGTIQWTASSEASQHPAPLLVVQAAAGGGSAGELEISGGFTRATLPKAPVGGGYITIANNGEVDDRLVAASSPAAERVELHEMRMEGDVMKMAEREAGIEIPAGSVVTLAPGGLHIMFIGLVAPFVEGATVPVTLRFEKAGEVEVELQVGPVGAAAPMPMTGGDVPQVDADDPMPHGGGDMPHAM